MSDVEEALARAADVITNASEVCLACHVSPDGDALGSMLALHHALVGSGRRSIASFSEPFVIAPHYRELPGLDLLTPPDTFPREPSVMVTFDSCAVAPLGCLDGP